jgi:hypothetical protein
MTDFRSAITEELNAIEYDLLCTEKAHFIAAEELKKVHLWVGLLATASAGASTATILAAAPAWISGALALVATLSSGSLTFLKPEEKATQHLAAGRTFGAVRTLAHQYRQIDLMREPLDLDACRGYVAEISQAKKYANGICQPE